MKTFCQFASVAYMGCLLATQALAVEGPHHILINQNYDLDAVGQMPSGWSGLPSVNANAYVTNGVNVTAPNSFALSYTNGNPTYLIQTVSPVSYSLTNADQWIAYELDVNVDRIDSNNSEGFALRFWNATYSRIDAGAWRILANSGGWQFYNGQAGQNGGYSYLPTIYNFDTWHHLRIKLQLDGDTGPVASPYFGRAFWYVDNALVNTETWTNRTFNQVREIDTVDIANITNLGGRMYIDNLVVEAIPEPSTIAFLVAGGVLLIYRRRK